MNKFKKMSQQGDQVAPCPSGVGGGVADPPTPPPPLAPPPLQVGNGPQKKIISWPVSDPSVHPNYSIENKIDTSLSEYETISNSTIPEYLKAKLLSHYHTKYLLNKRQVNEVDDDDCDDDDDDDDSDSDDCDDDVKIMIVIVMMIVMVIVMMILMMRMIMIMLMIVMTK